MYIDLIPNKAKVFIHCYSTSVNKLLIDAHKAGKRFTVYNTEIRPKHLGRRAAKDLAKEGLKVTHLPDLAGPETLKTCDLLLFGAEKIKKDGTIINKIGTRTLVDVAKKSKIPIYCITKEKKSPKKRINSSNQLWKSPPKNIKVLSPGHEELKDKAIKIIEL